MTYEQYEQDGAYRSAAEIIEDLERQLAAVTAERDKWHMARDKCERQFQAKVEELATEMVKGDELRERLQRCEQDAVRYQWLKVNCGLADLLHEPDTQIQIEDATIDAALHTEAK